jgi:hypothetical protein
MGTAHIQISESLLKRLEENFSDQIVIINAADFGDGSYSVLVSSDQLPDGYNGVHEIYIVHDEKTLQGFIRFRREMDT